MKTPDQVADECALRMMPFGTASWDQRDRAAAHVSDAIRADRKAVAEALEAPDANVMDIIIQLREGRW